MSYRFKFVLKPDYKEFIKEIEKREIEFLVHFTITKNLIGIFEQRKILSRAILEKNKIDFFDIYEFMDDIRFDDKNYINLSIQHPNSLLFSRFRQKTADKPDIYWCVLKIDKKYIYHADTLFSVTNAANSINRKYIGITGDIHKFRMMFKDSLTIETSHGLSRIITRGNLKPKYPTDVQAEVLVKNEIPINDVLEFCFENEEDLASAKAAFALYGYDTSRFVIDPQLFCNRENK